MTEHRPPFWSGRRRTFGVGALTATLLFAGAGCASTGGDTDRNEIGGPSGGTAIPGPPPGGSVGDLEEKEVVARRIYKGGVDLFERHEYDLALMEFQRALSVDPEFYRAWFKSGLCYYELRRYDLEIDAYHRCETLAPGFIDNRLNLAIAYLFQDELEKAADEYEAVLKIDSKNEIALWNLGVVDFDLHRYQRCIEVLGAYVEDYPNGAYRARAEQFLKEAREALQNPSSTERHK